MILTAVLALEPAGSTGVVWHDCIHSLPIVAHVLLAHGFGKAGQGRVAEVCLEFSVVSGKTDMVADPSTDLHSHQHLLHTSDFCIRF